jgi:hypothetical protein
MTEDEMRNLESEYQEKSMVFEIERMKLDGVETILRCLATIDECAVLSKTKVQEQCVKELGACLRRIKKV